MKVLHVTQGYSPAIGGTEFLIQRISEELVRQFYDEVTVFTTNCYSAEAFFTPRLRRMPAGWEEINGVQVRRFAVNSRLSRLLRFPQALAYRLHLPGNQYLRALGSGPIIPGLKQAIADHKADVVAASSFPLLHMFAALQAAHESGRPCILHGGLHPQDFWGFDRPMIYQAIRQADAYIANTDYEAEYVISRGVCPEKVTTIGVGVDLERFQTHTPETARRALNLGSYPLVGFIGQISWAKGVGTLLLAMKQVWQVLPEARLLIAGARTLYCQHLERLISDLPAEHREKVILHYDFGDDEKPLLFSAIDVLAYPSGYESFGIAFLEAWAAQKPVVGCRRGAVPWVIEPGADGLLVDYFDFTGLAEALLLLLRNPLWAQRLGQRGYEKTRARYTWPDIARRFRAIYTRVSQVG